MTSKAQALAALLAILATSSPAEAFQLAPTSSRWTSLSTRRTRRTVGNVGNVEFSQLSMSDGLSEVEKLRAAAAKAREEYERLSREAGKEVISSPTTATTTALQEPTTKLSPAELQTIANTIDFSSGDATTQSQTLDELVDTGKFTSWKSAIRRGPTTSSSSMSLLQPFPVTLQSLETRTNGLITGPSLGIGGEGDVKFEDFQDLTIAVVLGSTLAGIASLALLPPNVGATFTYLFALIPIGFIGIGSTAPGIIAGVIAAAKGEKEGEEQRRERVCRHEAGHFLCGYLCGLPVKNYEVNGDTGVACVEFHTGGQNPAIGAELTEDEISSLSVVAMSGSVAEILAYGKATGGENDLIELQRCFRQSKDFIGAAKQQDLTRWGALTSFNLIRNNMDKYEGLVGAFKENKSLAECVAIIEGTDRFCSKLG